MFRKMIRAGRRVKGGEKNDIIAKDKTNINGVWMRNRKKSDKIMSYEKTNPAGNSNVIPLGKTWLENKPVQLRPIKEQSKPPFTEPLSLLLPHTSCTVNLCHLGSSQILQRRWVYLE